MLMWGDMLTGRRDLLGGLPSGVTVCEWGYDDWYPFDERCADLASAGVPFWVAPGTSSWLSILGRATNARMTCRRAAEAALAHGGAGYLNTDWGDNGHLQQAVVSEPALSYGAAVSWCLEANAELDLAGALSAHVFKDHTGGLADAVLALGDVHRLITPQFPNMSALVTNLYYPQLPVGRSLTEGLVPEELDAVDTCLDNARSRARESGPDRADGALLVNETVFGADLVALLVRDMRARFAGDGTIGSVPGSVRDELAAELDTLTERYRALWLARNRPGGLDDSVAWLDNLHDAYRTGHASPTWGGLPAPVS
jgi:hexosaminidase